MAKVESIGPDEHCIVTDAVAEAERQTDGEIVTVIARESDDYRETPIYWAVAVMFLALACIAVFPDWFANLLATTTGGWEHVYTPSEYLTLIMLLLAAKFGAVHLIVGWKPLRLALTPPAIKRARVRARAINLFRVSAEKRTRGLTGVLIYLSMAEHRAEIVADSAIAAKVSPDIWGEAMADMIVELRAGRAGEGMAAAVRDVGKVLAEHFPKSDDNPNELPDRLIEL
ncbi:putative membrane protein [Blastomonas natatoria]|uniref:Putative membrane protein n=1 Tax=Blastomonas natatoria TaxID=34015 RepID=A0A2V3V9M7_9SPHN|nr:TPM domain-containing protein [Blastomonas natatoria]PXW78522.1 putative membrane protein [Blastomonas natatoria]